MKTLLAVIVVVAGLAALSVGVVVATSHNSTEVRIAAKRLDDGRIEVALQQRELDGSWGDRLLPTRRFVPASGHEGRWLTSSPVQVALPSAAPGALLSVSGLAVADGPPSWRTLQHVIARDELWCGVKQTQRLLGFREADGTVSGFEIEFCKAIAAAVLGDATKVKYLDASAATTRFKLLRVAEFDVLIHTDTVSASRDLAQGIDFALPIFYDGQGFLVRKDSGYESTADMDGVGMCFESPSVAGSNVHDHFTDIGLTYDGLASYTLDEIADHFFSGRCDVLTADASELALRVSLRDDAEDYTILPQVITRKPLAPGVRDYDSEWKDVVNWVVHGLIAAEELGVTQGNVAEMATDAPSSEIARLLGVSYLSGEVRTLGFDSIDAQFIQRAIVAVGNYGEIYERTIGDYIPRACTLNALAIDASVDCPPGLGGVLHALPYY